MHFRQFENLEHPIENVLIYLSASDIKETFLGVVIEALLAVLEILPLTPLRLMGS